MELGSIADWINTVATALLALAAVWFSIRQFRQQRDPELRVVLKSVAGGRDGTKGGYELAAINNSEGNCVVLQNTTSPLVTEARADTFKVMENGKLIDSREADKFNMDQEILPQNIATLWRFTNMLRGRIPRNSHAGSADEMDWYFYDAVNEHHYQVTICQSADAQRLIARLDMQNQPYPKEQWGQELEIRIPQHYKDEPFDVVAINQTKKRCQLQDITGELKKDLGQVAHKQQVTLHHFDTLDQKNGEEYCYYDAANHRYYRIVVRYRYPTSEWPEVRVQSQTVAFE